MEFDHDYRDFVSDVGTKKVTGEQNRISWAIEEMCAEANECLGVSVKAKRKGQEIDKDRLWDELGDTLWGLTAVLNEAFPKNTLQDLMIHNVKKLKAREAAKSS